MPLLTAVLGIVCVRYICTHCYSMCMDMDYVCCACSTFVNPCTFVGSHLYEDHMCVHVV